MPKHNDLATHFERAYSNIGYEQTHLDKCIQSTASRQNLCASVFMTYCQRNCFSNHRLWVETLRNHFSVNIPDPKNKAVASKYHYLNKTNEQWPPNKHLEIKGYDEQRPIKTQQIKNLRYELRSLKF